MRILLIIAFSLGLCFEGRAGGPWTQGKNEGILIANISPVVYRTYSAADGSAIDMWRRVAEVTTQAYFELGLSERFLLFGNLKLVYAGTSQKTFDTDDFNTVLAPGRVFGMGNSSAGMKYRFNDGPFLVAASFAIEFPGSSRSVAEGLQIGYDAWTFLPGLHFGQGFDFGLYYIVEGAFAAHTDISHEYRLHAEIGHRFKKPLIMAVGVHVKESLKNRLSSLSGSFRQTGLYLNDQEYISWEVKFTHEVTETIGWTTALAGGFRTERIARTPVISAGMYFKWKSRSFEDPDFEDPAWEE